MSDRQRDAVLVTGGAGFIGSHLVEDLVRQGHDVVVVDDLSTGDAGNLAAVHDRVDLRRLDLRTDAIADLLGSRRFTTVYHLAANAYVPPSVEDPRRDMEINVLGTFNLLDAMRATGSDSRLVNVSSAAVYGGQATEPLQEGDPTHPVSPYAVSKLAAERYVAVFASIYGVRAANVRLFPVYGPRLRKQVIFDLMTKVAGDPAELAIHGDGSQVRDFNHVLNVVEALQTIAARAEFAGEVYNVAGDEPVAIADIARRVCDAMGASPRFAYSGDVRPGDSQRLTADIGRLLALGYQPRLRLDDGLVDTVRWFRDEHGDERRAAAQPA